MDELQGYQHAHRRGPHGKRLFKHGGIDSPLYDASEEDNDGRGDEASSFSGPYIPLRNSAMIPAPGPSLNVGDGRLPNSPPTTHDPSHPSAPAVAHGLQSNVAESLRRDRADSPTYDGDVESSTAGYKDPPPAWSDPRKPPGETYAGETKAQGGPSSSPPNAPLVYLPCGTYEPESTSVLSTLQIPTALTTDDIRAYVQAAIDQDPNSPRTYRPKPPPKGRPVRVYADGVYDIFHFGHALQLRQAKLSFPSVHLMVGVCSDELCSEHKSRTVMSHAERCESVRHCRWVDEILPDAPWVVDQAFIDKHQIDYVAHDDDPYKGSDGSDDVYHYVKMTGQFIPTRRTPGVSTSELLERIVAGYREGDWDAKLVKIGHPELTSRAPSRATSRPESRIGVLQPLDVSRLDDSK
ncbi:hypothetical protein M407DRAFT_28320 [Tulasnella calospora MUT 4182]|uniref:choline-phosphate cytidylyltransferase n=1 Tax=Tulasnella calospora MUT 4182 TaxID=1051891 RepID=A0A0C3Q1J9_9AGAM|nr:hypothetical protein M407DRAFT_28320 [Tulasnella calospora MUT 4182]